MLSQIDQIRLIQSKGLTAEAALYLFENLKELDEAQAGGWLASSVERHRLSLTLQEVGLLRHGVALDWAGAEEATRLWTHLQHAGVGLVWRNEAEYPARLRTGLGTSAPAWLWLAGDRQRLSQPTCGMIGSRESTPLFLTAARRLSQALAEAGLTVVSGMAPGADTAAHEGALQGRAGTIAVPARGILKAGLTFCRASLDRGRQGAMTYLALDRPDTPFSAGLAIRRNGVIGALSDGLVLVASDLVGGSAYGVNWILEHGRPLWCFEAGAQTPPANGHLLRRGLAQPLGLEEEPEAWVERIAAGVERWRASRKIEDRCESPSGESAAGKGQLDWLSEA